MPELPEQAAAGPAEDDLEPHASGAERPADEAPPDAVEVDPHTDLAGRLAHDEQLPASWRPDIAAALARGCTPEQIVDAYRAPLSGKVRSPAAVRRRRLHDLQPAPAPVVTPTPPNIRTMCRLHSQPGPCPVCADLAADAATPAGPAQSAPRRAAAATPACVRSPATMEAFAELRARLPRSRR